MKPLRILVYACVLFLVVVLSVKVLVNNPPPPGYSLDNMPRVGLDADYNFAPSVLNAASSSGAKVIRAHMSWTTLEPQNTDPSHYTWATYDSIFSRIASAGLSPILVIDKCPAWACPFMRGPVNAANMNDYSEMVNAVVTRYSQPPYSVRFWELLDEPDGAAGPNGQWGYANHPAEYVQALAVLHTAVKGLNPEAVVLNGGIAYDYPTGFRREFVGEMLAAGGGRYIDALNFHYFRINGPGWATIGQKAAELRGIMRTAGVDLPLVCTSTGESSENIAPWNSTEAQQARYVVKVNAQAAAAGIRSTVWYLTQDFDCPAGACPSGWEVWARHGLIRQNATPKMAHAAMTTFNTEIGSGAFQRQLGAESGVTGSLEGYHFGGSAEGRPQVWVVWNNAATPGTLIIPAALVAGLQRAVGMSGQLVATSPGTGGAVLVVVGPDPIYLEWRGSRFVDVPQGSTYYTYIEALAQMGATSGYLDGTYRPDANAMRGHISKVIVLAQGWAIDTTNGPHFTDVPPLSAFYQYVETAYNHGIISGYSDGTFRPYNTVTRGQLCKIISIARGWDLVSPPTPTFRDVPSGNAFYTYIETAFSHNIISGYSDGTFRWGSNSTRGQVAKIVYNAVR